MEAIYEWNARKVRHSIPGREYAMTLKKLDVIIPRSGRQTDVTLKGRQ
jgi:hypothetical protein